MKKYILLLLIFFSVGTYGAKYNFEYKSLPKVLDYRFDYDIKSQTKEGVLQRPNLVTAYVTLDNGLYSGVIKNDILGVVASKRCDFTLENEIKSLKVSNLNQRIHQSIDLPEDILSGQFILPEKELEVGDLWYAKVKNPLADKELVLECRLIRVADNVATVSYSIKSPFRPVHVVTERELMEEKLHDGSTFYFKIDTLGGHAEITGSGMWVFDIDKGELLSSDQFYKVTSLMRVDDRADIKSVDDFIYVDVTIHYKYKFSY